MGSGSSKAKSQKTAPKKTVANVNKEEKKNVPQEIKQDPPREITKSDEIHPVKRQEQNEYERKQNEKNKKEKSNKKKMKEESLSFKDRQDSGLVFEDDSDVDNDIDEVLKIPMAIEYDKSKNSKSKKDQRGRDSQQESNFNNNVERDSSLGRRDENLPETYAQRLQRQQYKLQQDMLIRQKTLYRNPNEWDNTYEQEEETQPRGFDASRFRDANKKAALDGKKELFTTNDNDELMTPRYLKTGQDLDELQYNRRTESPDRKVPSYNQSELDLMAELERDLL